MHPKTRIGLALIVALACSVPGLAAEEATEQFTFVIPNAPESTVDGQDRFRLTLNRWSTDDERAHMLEVATERGTADLLDAFRDTGAIGYLRWPGGLEYSVRYAYRAERPDGGADVVLVVGRPLWLWWNAAAEGPGDVRFSVVQLRLNAQGAGEGRLSNGAKIATDTRLGVLVPDYASRPVLLSDVRREDLGE